MKLVARDNDHEHDPTDVFRQVRRPEVIAHPRPALLPHPVALAHPRLIPRLPRAPRGTEHPPPVERQRPVTPSEDFDEDSTTMPTMTYARVRRAVSNG
jgi:hypothetical protein